VFSLWDREQGFDDVKTDRPYAALAFDAASDSFFVACFGGIDLTESAAKSDSDRKFLFRKNPSDAIVRYHRPSNTWHAFDRHQFNAAEIAPERTNSVPNKFYPLDQKTPPCGFLNGPNGLLIDGKYLYAVAKDNHLLVRYDLTAIRANPSQTTTPLPEILGQGPNGEAGEEANKYDGPCALAISGNKMFIAFRSNGRIYRFDLDTEGQLIRNTWKLVAYFPVTTQTKGTNLIDMKLDNNGQLFAAVADGLADKQGAVWKIPSDAIDFKPTSENAYARFPNSTISAIAFDAENQLYVCSNAKEGQSKLGGTIYRVRSSAAQ
jgi:hypothetical protein